MANKINGSIMRDKYRTQNFKQDSFYTACRVRAGVRGLGGYMAHYVKADHEISYKKFSETLVFKAKNTLKTSQKNDPFFATLKKA